MPLSGSWLTGSQAEPNAGTKHLVAPANSGNGALAEIMPDKALVESFNGRLRDECLNANWFLSLADAKSKIKTWRRHYNESHPLAALG